MTAVIIAQAQIKIKPTSNWPLVVDVFSMIDCANFDGCRNLKMDFLGDPSVKNRGHIVTESPTVVLDD